MVSESDSGNGNTTDKTFTDDEAALYDRQIRLWGVDAQKRLNASKVLIIGIGGVGAEVAKNIILGGVKSVTLLDSNVVTEDDTAYQFLAPRDSVGKNRAESSLPRAQQLNPMVQVSAESSSIDDKPDDYFTNFTLVIATNCTPAQIQRLNRITRDNDVKFLASEAFGFFGYIFLDLGEHRYKTEKMSLSKTKSDVVSVVDGLSRYISFQDTVSIDWNLDEFATRAKKTRPGLFGLLVLLDFLKKTGRKPAPATRDGDLLELLKLRDEFIERNGIAKERIPDEFFDTVFGEVGPTSAIIGGVLAQEVVKALSQKDAPLVNIFLCNPLTGTGYVENLVE